MPHWLRNLSTGLVVSLATTVSAFAQTPQIIDVAPGTPSRGTGDRAPGPSADPAEVPVPSESPRSPERAESDQTGNSSHSSANSSAGRPSGSAEGSQASLPSPNPEATRVPLAPRREESRTAPTTPPLATGSTVTTVFSSLAIVLGLFFLVVWFCRRTLPKSSALLPQDAVESLGRAPLAHRQFMHLVRIGRKLVLLSVTPNGAETLSEITDPVEVEHLLGLCQQNNPNSISESFRQILSQFADEGPESSTHATIPLPAGSSRPTRRRAA